MSDYHSFLDLFVCPAFPTTVIRKKKQVAPKLAYRIPLWFLHTATARLTNSANLWNIFRYAFHGSTENCEAGKIGTLYFGFLCRHHLKISQKSRYILLHVFGFVYNFVFFSCPPVKENPSLHEPNGNVMRGRAHVVSIIKLPFTKCPAVQ